MRQSALLALYESVKQRVSVDFEEFAAALSDWNVIPLEQAGEVIGAFIEKDGEIHVGYREKPKGSILKHIKETMSKVIAERGAVITKVAESNTAGVRFCNRLGFSEVKREQGIVFMRCERCNYA